jgi:tetratricopeptide (TPR) repeat protein
VSLYSGVVRSRESFVTHQLLNAALAHHRAGRLQEAEALYREILLSNPVLADAHHLLGVIAFAKGNLDEAKGYVSRAINLAAMREAYHLTMGQVLHRQGDLEGAESSHLQALRISPAFPEARNALGVVFEAQGKLTSAKDQYLEAIKLRPGFAEAFFNLGNVERRLRQSPEAEAAYRRAIALRPDFADAHYMLGKVLLERGNDGQALSCYRQAIALNPQYAAAHEALSHLFLTQGRLQEGWREYAWRSMGDRYTTQGPPAIALPSNLAGMELVLKSEQGLGDALFFLRGAGDLRVRGATLHFWGDHRLVSLLKRTGLFDQYFSYGDRPDTKLSCVQMGELPSLLAWNDLENLPHSISIEPQPHRMQTLRKKLEALGDPPYRGVTWRAGSKDADHALYKEVPLDELGTCLSASRGTLISLQRNPEPGETAHIAARATQAVHDWSSLNDDLEDMLALLKLLDEYVGVSNTNMHLCAAVGTTARVLVPHPPEWRWMLEGEISPWFPDFRIYRQTPDHGWGPALEALRKDLS